MVTNVNTQSVQMAVYIIRRYRGWSQPARMKQIEMNTAYCETNCETYTPVDTESVTHKMAELLQIDWSVVHTK